MPQTERMAQDQVAVVTGASRGIGRAIAIELAAAGYTVIGVARSAERLQQVAGTVGARGGQFRVAVADLTHDSAITDIADVVADTMKPLGVLVNAAGVIVRSEPPDVDPLDFDLMLRLNVRAPLLLSQALYGSFAPEGASIVNVASIAAEEVTRAPVAYQASKAALVQLTRGLAMRWGPQIRVNAVGPGYIETDLNRQWLSDPDNLAYVEHHTALNRVGAPEDVVGVVRFLVSAEAAYITGQHILVDGGWHTP